MWILFDQITGAVQGLFMIEALNFPDRVEQSLFVTIDRRISRIEAAVQTEH
jgi:hypothetical protein